MTLPRLLAKAAWAALLHFSLAPAMAADAPPPDCPPVATAPSQVQVRTALLQAKDHGFLWRVNRDGHSSYLYGTIHAARFEWMFPGPVLSQALRASNTLALELDLLDPDIMHRLLQAARVTSAPLPPALQQRFVQHVRRECLPEQDILSYIPEMGVATLMAVAARREGLDPGYGIDVFLSGWARGGQKPVLSLETPELQIKTLQMRTPAETAQQMSEALDQLDSGLARTTLVKVAQAWADSDLSTLTQYESWCECVATPEDRAAMVRLLDDRNPAMAEAIVALHGQGKVVFAAIGSLHMLGPKGLPALLAQRGFQVETLLPRQASPAATEHGH